MVAEKVKEMFLAKKSKPLICDTIAKHLRNNWIFKTVSGIRFNTIYVYDKGIFINKGKDLIETKCEEYLGEFGNMNLVNEIRSKIERQTLIDREDFEKKHNDLVCIENGVLNIKTRELFEHSPDYGFINKFPLKYNANARCPLFFDFIDEVLYSEEEVLKMQEWFGYHLLLNNIFKKGVIFKGPKNTGKTTMMQILSAFIGGKNYCTKTLKDLSTGKWHIAQLFGKFANICDELSSKAIDDTDFIKSILGNSILGAEYKFGDSFEFVSYAKHTYACNEIPDINVKDNDDAYYNRWEIFHFETVFDRTNNKMKMSREKEIVDNEEEMSGILNWALDGLDRLITQRYFTGTQDWVTIRDEMKQEDTVYAFANICCEMEMGARISKSDLFENEYRTFCSLNNKTPVGTLNKFTREMKKHLDYIIDVNQDGVVCFRNLKINKEKMLMSFNS